MDKFYPTPSTTSYYINEFLIDDVYRVDFKRDVRKQPIFGYDSQRWDFVARGKEIVTGNVVINFRYPGYMRNMIKENARRSRDTTTKINNLLRQRSEEGHNQQAYELMKTVDGVASVDQKLELVGNYLLNLSVQDQAPNIEKTTSRIANNPNIDVRPSPEVRSNDIFLALKRNFEKRQFFDSLTLEEDLGHVPAMDSPLDEDHDPFDITVRYGFRGVQGGYVRIFKDVHLIGEGQVVSASAGVSTAGGMLEQSSSAQPIYEVYPFIARTIQTKRYEG
jgi:hypothetical protein